MFSQHYFIAIDVLIIFLIGSIVYCILKIRRLQKQLSEEKRKRLFPLLMLDVDSDDLAAYLLNDSYCYAKDINIQDLNMTLDYGFKKNLRLKFETIDFLKPNQRAELKYRVFDREYDVTSSDSNNLALYFENPDFEMHINYCNIENSKFSTTIYRNKSKFSIKETKLVS